MKENYKNIKVSVVIPVYNRQEFLGEAVESVLAQDLTEIEIIIVNDGSTDQSAVVAKEYQAKDRRIIYMEQENQGVSVARNKGMAMAKGEYLYFLDSDDILGQGFLSSSYAMATEKKFDLLVCGAYFLDRFPQVMALQTCALFMKKSFLDQHPDVQFLKGIQPGEDGVFSHELLALTDKIGINLNTTYFYREHEGQNTSQIKKQTDKVLQVIPIWLKELEKFYERYNLWDKKALHLARFIEHEPFEFRYMAMPFQQEQKQHLFQMIRDFMDSKVLPRLTERDRNVLSAAFIGFLQARSAEEFDAWYQARKLKNRAKVKALYLVSKLLPSRKWKKSFRAKMKKKYD